MAIEPDVPPSFPSELPPRPSNNAQGSFKDRNCPNMRTCWHVSISSYDPRHTPDKRTLFRRLAMIFILLFRTGMSILTLVSAISAKNVAGIVIYAILTVLGFWFIAWCLAEIGQAKGERRVFGKIIGRKHLDGFLYGIAIVHTALVVLYIVVARWGEGVTWLAMGLFIFAVAWICTWPPEYPPSNV